MLNDNIEDLIVQTINDYKAWNQHPTRPELANKCEDSCQALAAALGMGCTKLRVAITAHRKAGMSTEEAVTTIVRENE